MKVKAAVHAEEQLRGPPLPQALAYLWIYFQEHSMGLSQTGMGPAVVTWESLSGWCALTGITLLPWEAKAMVRLGVMRATVEAEKLSKETKTKK